MRRSTTVFTQGRRLAILWAFAVAVRSAWAQSGVTSGLYEIVSGSYTECCGIAGEFRFSVPNERQSFVRLTVDTQRDLATMSFVGKDLKTTFSVVPCPIGNPIQFSFDYGFIFSNSIVFQVDPGPPPYGIYWDYSVSNSVKSLQINGTLGMVYQGCADSPTQFGHSNVVAQLVSGPSMSVAEFTTEGALLFIQGHAGWTNVIEASTNLVTWTSISTNVMPATPYPNSPYILFRDAAGTNMAGKFYRSFEIP